MSSQPLTLQSTLPLSSGHTIPRLGYGVYQTPAADCERVCLHALKLGYRHIDSAHVYRNESACASAIRKSGIPRSEIFFTTKIPPKSKSYDDARRALDESFAATGEQYFDLVLLHSPYNGKEARLGGWKALYEAQKQGKVRSIGVSNYGVHHLEELKGAIASDEELKGSRIDVNQIECNPYLPHEDIVSWCQREGVAVQAWGPLLRGEMQGRGEVSEVAKKHGVTDAQVLIRWSLQMGFVPLPKSVTDSRIEENADVFGFELDEGDMKKLHFPNSYVVHGWDPTVHRD